MRTKEEKLSLLKGAQDEINLVLHGNKSQDVKEVYLKNAVRFIGYVMEDLQQPFTEERHQILKRVSHRVMDKAYFLTLSYTTTFNQFMNEEEQEGVSFEELLPYLYIGGKVQ